MQFNESYGVLVYNRYTVSQPWITHVCPEQHASCSPVLKGEFQGIANLKWRVAESETVRVDILPLGRFPDRGAGLPVDPTPELGLRQGKATACGRDLA